MLDFEVHQDGEICVVAAVGELDLATAPTLSATLAAAPAHGAARVVLDLRQLTFIDSSGIGAIIKIQRHFSVEGIGFGVIKGDERVQRAFELAHVELLLPWTDPEPDGRPG